MKRDDMDIDEILKRYLPRAPQEEVEAAGEQVLERIRAMRFPSASAMPDAAEQPKAEAKAQWLPKFDRAVLAAVDEMQGQGRAVTITRKVEELLEERMVSGSAVFVILLLLERRGLVSSSPIDPDNPALDRRYFQITAAGRETLAAANAAATRFINPLEDFA